MGDKRKSAANITSFFDKSKNLEKEINTIDKCLK